MDIRKEAVQANAKLSTLEKVSYSFTDMAGNLLYVSTSACPVIFFIFIRMFLTFRFRQQA